MARSHCRTRALRAVPCLGALALSAPGPAAAQQASGEAAADQVHNLREVTVVAPTPLPGFTIERQAFAGNAQTATDGDLERVKAPNLTAFLAETMTGVVVNDAQGNPFAQDILYRGYRLSPTLGSAQGLSLYLDGVRQNAALGDVIHWAAIPEPRSAPSRWCPAAIRSMGSIRWAARWRCRPSQARPTPRGSRPEPGQLRACAAGCQRRQGTGRWLARLHGGHGMARGRLARSFRQRPGQPFLQAGPLDQWHAMERERAGQRQPALRQWPDAGQLLCRRPPRDLHRA